MKKNNTRKLRHTLIIGIAFVMFSCNMTPDLVSPAPMTATSDAASVGTAAGPIFSLPVTLDRISIFTSSSRTLSGTVTIEIASSDGSVILGSSVLPGSSMVGSKWTTFYFTPITLMAGTRYRIQVKRSSTPNWYTDYIHWGSSSGSADAYPKGNCYVSGTYPYDMSFISYSGGYVDQKQTAHHFFWGIDNRYPSWQEFVPERIWVIHP